MKIISRITLAIAALVALAFTSCDSDDNKQEMITTQRIQNCYAAVTDLTTNSTDYINGVTFALDLNWTSAEAHIIIAGLKTGSQLSHVTLDPMKWGRDGDDGWCKVSVPTVGGKDRTNQSYVISDFTLRWIDRLGLGQLLDAPQTYFPGCNFSFVIDGRWRVVGAYAPFVLFGETETIAPDGSEFESEKTYYSVQPDFSKMTANIVIFKAKFAEAMRVSLNIRFPNVPMTVAPDGKIILSEQALIPEIIPDESSVATPFPNAPISDVYAIVDPASGMRLSFKCNLKMQGPPTLYTVNAEVNYHDFDNLKN